MSLVDRWLARALADRGGAATSATSATSPKKASITAALEVASRVKWSALPPSQRCLRRASGSTASVYPENRPSTNPAFPVEAEWSVKAGCSSISALPAVLGGRSDMASAAIVQDAGTAASTARRTKCDHTGIRGHTKRGIVAAAAPSPIALTGRPIEATRQQLKGGRGQ